MIISVLISIGVLFFAAWLLSENTLQSRQRKMVYAVTVLVLLIPIIYLGAPTSEDVEPASQAAVSGGVLAQMRVKHDLGESRLGQIDPSSAAMSLVLLGLRGPAASVLHLKALEYQEKKDWAKLKTTVDSIIKLQPHYIEIWRFQGWNLAFNVSREWDRVTDRFYWVKEGIKFLQLGTRRNATATNLFHNVGDFTGRKFGNSDEKKFFRKFFVHDPDVATFGENSPDPEINPQGVDNYLMAYEWFKKANELDRIYRIKGMTHVIARQGPARALYDYAVARQKEGFFGEENRRAWDNAYKEWTDNYGNDIFFSMDLKYKLNCSEAELVELAEENGVPPARQKQVWEQNVKMVNYRFWQNLANCERDELTVAAHKAIYEGKVAFSLSQTADRGENQPSIAEEKFTEGMELLAQMFEKHPEVADHDGYIEEALLALLYYERIHRLNIREMPEDFPFKDLALKEAGRRSDLEREFLIETQLGLR